MSSPPSNKKAKTLTPHELYLEEQKAFMETQGLVDSILVQGIVEDGTNEDDDDDAKNLTYTAEQVGKLRYVMLTKERAAAMKRYRKKILGEQAESKAAMKFNTSYSFIVFDEQFCLDCDLKKQKNLAEQFNMLFAFTNTVHQYNVWLKDYDDEDALIETITGLAESWKTMLKKTDAQLGIDTEYTRPGVLAFLEKFKTLVENADSEDPIEFKYQWNGRQGTMSKSSLRRHEPGQHYSFLWACGSIPLYRIYTVQEQLYTLPTCSLYNIQLHVLLRCSSSKDTFWCEVAHIHAQAFPVGKGPDVHERCLLLFVANTSSFEQHLGTID